VHGVLYQVLTTEPKPLRTLAPSIPAALERVVGKAMNKVPDERYETAAQMQSTLLGIRAALSGAGDETTQRLGIRWTPLPAPVLKLVTQAPMKWRIAVLSALAIVVALLLFSPAPPAADEVAPPRVTERPTVSGPVASQIPPVSPALSARRDSALAARDRAVRAGALKNNTTSMVLAENLFQVSEQALIAGNQTQALNGYVAVVEQYRRATTEAQTLQRDATEMIQRVTPTVQAIPAGPAVANAATFLARADSLLRAQDYTMAKVAAQSAEQVAIDAGIAPASSQPADARGAIEVLLTDLGRALASERVGNVRVIYPKMTDAERHGWETFFHDWDQITARFTIERFNAQGAAANADVRALFGYIPAGGGAPRQDRRRFGMRFEKSGVGWRVSTVKELK
jgi:hypothetical protein